MVPHETQSLSNSTASGVDAPRAGAPDPLSPEQWRAAIVQKLTYMVGKDPGHALDHDWFIATALAVRDRVIDRWMESTRATYRNGSKRVYYFSLEFLIGRMLFDAMCNLGLTASVREALDELGVDLDRLHKLEPDAALGNGGLGRLAACFLESMSSLGIAAHGYGIRYDHGIFRQVLHDGWQHELPEEWLSFGNPWEFERPEIMYSIGFGGTVDEITLTNGLRQYRWHPAESVNAVAFDTPIPGWRGRAREHAAPVVGARGRSAAHLADFNRRRPRRRAGRSGAAGGHLARAVPQRRDCGRRRTCACARNISSRRPRCRTCCGGTSSSTANFPRWRTTSRSSSTTRIRPSRCRN